MGHISLPEGISTDQDELKVVQVLPTPETKHKIRSFLACVPTTGGLSLVSMTFQNH